MSRETLRGRLTVACTAALFGLSVAPGCSDDTTTPTTDTATTDTATTDTATTDTAATDTAATDTSDGKVGVSYTLIDFLSRAPLEGVDVAIGGTTETTDATGTATFRLDAGVDIVAHVTGAGLRDHFLHQRSPSADTSYTYTIATDTTIAAFQTILGLTVDDTRGIISLSPREKGTGASIPGMTITTDAASDLTLVFDASSATGLSAGNVTLAGSSSTAIVVNIAAGDATPTFDHPAGYVCDVGPIPVNVPAGAYVIANYECAPTRVTLGLTLEDFLSKAPLEGATVEVGSETEVADADGRVSFLVPQNSDVVAKVTGGSFRDHYLHLRVTDVNLSLRYDIATATTVAAISTILGLTVDNAKGILTLSPRAGADWGTSGFIPGMTVTTDGDPAVSLVIDADSATGISVGDTTLAGSPSTVILVNVTAGDVTPTFTHPWGYTCDVGPTPVDVPAGSHVVAAYQCAYTPIDLTLQLLDFLSQAPLEGLNVTIGEATAVTDAAGSATFALPPNADFVAHVTGAGTRDHHIHRRSPGVDATLAYTIATDTTVAAFQTILGLTVNNDKGLVSIAPRRKSDGASIAGMTITTDATADLSLVFDASSGTGVSPGNVTLAGSASTAILINITAGDVTPSFVHDDGYVCDVGPWPLPIPAGSYVIANYGCEVPDDD